MALAFLLNAALFLAGNLLCGTLFYLAVVSIEASSKAVFRLLGAGLMLGIGVLFWGRLILPWGHTPAALGGEHVWEFGVAVAGALALIGIYLVWLVRVARALYRRRHEKISRRGTEIEMQQRDALGETTVSGPTFEDLEAALEGMCWDQEPARRSGFQFLVELEAPSSRGVFNRIIRCPLDMARDEGADHLHLAILRESELLALGVARWRLALELLFLVNPLGWFFAKGVLLSLDFLADARVASQEGRAPLVALISHVRGASGPGSSWDAASARLRRLEATAPPARFGRWMMAGAILCLPVTAAMVWRIGPTSLNHIEGVMSLTPPSYATVLAPPDGLVVHGVPGAGWKGKSGPIPKHAEDGLLIDTSSVQHGITTVTLHGFAEVVMDPTRPVWLVATCEARNRGGRRDSPPLFTGKVFKGHGAGYVTSNLEYRWAKSIPLQEGPQQVELLLSDPHVGFGSDLCFYLPPGWEVVMTDMAFKTSAEVAPQDEVSLDKDLRTSLSYLERFGDSRSGSTVENALDWSPQNLAKEREQ